jgi:hypothetical protein
MAHLSTLFFGVASYLASGIIAVPTGTLAARSPSGSKAVIIQMFEWTWDSIASECSSFIGPAGYGFVQGGYRAAFYSACVNFNSVSPPQEHVAGSQWWTDYQPGNLVCFGTLPLSYGVTSQSPIL